MEAVIKGSAHLFGLNIDTDQIYPGRYLELTDPNEIASHAMEGADPNFINVLEAGDIIVAGRNFGCGSSREHAAITLKQAKVGAVVAESFARIFFRNAINLGLPLMIVPGIAARVKSGDLLELDLLKGQVHNLSQQESYCGECLDDHVLGILAAGGIKELLQKEMEREG